MDIIEISDVKESVAQFGDGYLRRVFTQRELTACKGGLDTRRLAGVFAAKEAVLKTLGSDDEAVDLRSIEIVLARDHEPTVELSGRSAEIAARENMSRFAVSVSSTHDYAAAVVLAERER